jgi:hypothetical protein
MLFGVAAFAVAGLAGWVIGLVGWPALAATGLNAMVVAATAKVVSNFMAMDLVP